MIYRTVGGALKEGTLFKNENGWQRSHNGEDWSWSYSPSFYFATLIPVIDTETVSFDEDQERELFGETLDEPIPDDLFESITNI